jgi:hypothetical protein
MSLPVDRKAFTTPVYVSISQMSLPVDRKAFTTPVYVSISQMSLPVYRKASQHQFMLAFARCLCLFTGKTPQH